MGYANNKEAVVAAILEDYRQGREIDLEYGSLRPEKDGVVELTGKLQRIVFPGYFTDEPCRTGQIQQAMQALQLQLARVLQPEQAQKVCHSFFAQIPQVRQLVQTDLTAAYGSDPAADSMAEIIYAYPGLFAITVYRLAHVLYDLNVPMLPRIMTEYAHSATGIDIHPGAQIGKCFFIDHGTGIVIGQTTVIGDHVKIYQGVTLGGISTRGGQDLRGQRRHPTIGDRVTIYANATILGGQTVIGHDCVIGANTFITASVPPCTTVSLKDPQMQLKPIPGCCQ